MLDDMGCNTVMLRDNRYDAVMHMVTAADGAEKFYASLSNEARYESVEEAVDKDKKLREAYMGHQRWVMIANNYPDFNRKIKGALTNIHYILGQEAGNQFFKKFLLKSSTVHNNLTRIPVSLPDNQHFEESEVIETFLKHGETSANGRRMIESSI